MTGWRTAWYIVLAALAFLVVVEKALVAWAIITPKPQMEGWTLLVAGVLIFVDSVKSAVTTVSGEARGKRLHSAEKTVLASLKSISVASGVDLLSLGGSVFLAGKSGLLRREFLRRDLRYRLSDSPQPSDVHWVSGKGVVGQAWLQKKVIHKDWSAVAAKWGDGITEEAFNKLRVETKGGFTFQEFRGIVSKYAEILAVPIWDPNQKNCIGIYSIDVPMAVVHPRLGSTLKSNAIREVASNCAALLGETLGKK